MSDNKETSKCPFCGSENNCMAPKIEECWCVKTVIPQELLQLVPEDQKNKACICQSCVQAFKVDPDEFVNTLHH